jgi:hypothetical protein
VTNDKRTNWDDFLDMGREWLKRLDEFLHPEKKRKPARVPVPIRTNEPPYNPENH